MKRYKRQWRRRRAEERAQMELVLLTTAVMAMPAKGESDARHD
jgi:hypothetical protein